MIYFLKKSFIYKYYLKKIIIIIHLQVSSTDRLSVHVCHACISYLNSWQSFKNRCDAAQRKQKIWLSTSNDGKVQNTGQSLLKNQLNGHGNQLKPAIENAQQKFQEKQAELQRQKLQELVKQTNRSNDIDTSFIKSEPASDDDVSLTFFMVNKFSHQKLLDFFFFSFRLSSNCFCV